MQVQLAEQIRTFRREKHLTQEQLAEVLGVTVGTVSKWEGGSSTPDLSLIMELADFFGTSVDVLLGYRQQSASLASTLARLRALCSGKQYDEGRRDEYSGRFYTPIPEIGNRRSDAKETALLF